MPPKSWIKCIGLGLACATACTARTDGIVGATAGEAGDSFDAGDADDADDPDAPGSEPSDDAPGLGNFPEPAQSSCGTLPDGLEPIPGLASAWVAEGSFMGTNEQGEHVAQHGLRLRLSDGGVACDEAFNAGWDPCTTAWGWGMTLPDGMQTPGTYALSDWGGIYLEQVFQVVDATCGDGGEGGGDGGPEPSDMPGEIEILHIDDECVIGRIHDVQLGGTQQPSLSGGFVAMRCATECIPQYGESHCG